MSSMQDFKASLYGFLIGSFIGLLVFSGVLYVNGSFSTDLFRAGATGTELPTSVALFETSLASSITSSATSMTLVSATTKDGSALASSTYAFILDEGTASEEMVIADCTGTACVRMIRGVSALTGTTTVSTLQKAHRRGASVKITDGPQLVIISRILNGQGTVPSQFYYDDRVLIGVGSPTTTIASKYYVDSTVLAGCADANETTKGCVELATTAEAAAGTSAGGTAARLVVPNSMFNATPSSNVLVPVTSALGKLAQGFFDLTALWSFTGGLSSTGTTTISASNINTNPLKLNGLAYTFLSSRAASSTVLTEDGSGGLRFITPQSYVLVAAAPNTGTTGTATTSLATIKIPANTVTAFGQIEIEAIWETSTQSDVCGLQIDHGTGTATSTSGFFGFPTGPSMARSTTKINATSTASQAVTNTWVRTITQSPSSAVNTAANMYVPINYANTSYVSLAARSGAGSVTCTLSQYIVKIFNY